MKTKFTPKELRALHAKGFTLLWLKPKLKEPWDLGWTNKPRQDFDTFKKDYKPGSNVGVRLGSVSKVEGGYLAVLDLDVKGTKPEHQAQARAKLFELFPEVKAAPCVLSGRGNGSAHFYIAVPEAVRGNERKGQSTEIVKVKMPSAKKPSRKELDALTAKEIADGWRLRPAWEISLLCEGRQVVLPGSVHPDSGRHYAWAEGADLDVLPLPVIPLEKAKGTALIEGAFLGPRLGQSNGALQFEFRKVNLESLGLRPDQVASIKAGAGVTDRSASVFALSMAMLQRKVPVSDILSVFTDRENYLGQVAFDHAKTNDRARAARWLNKYTIPRAIAQTQPVAFAPEVTEVDDGEWVDEPSEPATKVKGKKEELEAMPANHNGHTEIGGNGAEAYAEADNWKFQLDLQPGPKGGPATIRSTFKNLHLILSNTIGDDFLRFDDFAQREFWAYDVPWGPMEGEQRSAGTQDEIKLKYWLIETWGIESSVNLLTETLAWFSGQNHFHPVKDYLESLEWDGVKRIDTAFETYLGVNMPKAYVRAVSRKFFLALIARIYEPGIKFDHLPVLEGKQGIGKSTFGRLLVGDKWFMDGLPELSDKDAALNLQGIWLCEMGELSALKRSDLETAKAFITRQVDKVRPPYGHRRVELPRQTVFLGTTNDREYLMDQTGNRRFWPILIRGCNFAAVKRDRDQLLAEAYYTFLTDIEPLYLEGEAKKLAEKIQESRRVEDDFDAMYFKVREWLALPPNKRAICKDVSRLRLEDVFEGALFGIQKNGVTRKTAGLVLRKLGYFRVQNRGLKVWVKQKAKAGRPVDDDWIDE